MSDLETSIKQMINAELDRRAAATELVPMDLFCQQKKISRVTMWRKEKEGTVKVIRIGKKLFVNPTQFV